MYGQTFYWECSCWVGRKKPRGGGRRRGGCSHIRPVRICAARKLPIFRPWPLLKTLLFRNGPLQKTPFSKTYTSLFRFSSLFLAPKPSVFSYEWPLWKPPFSVRDRSLYTTPPAIFKPCAAHIYQFHIWVPPGDRNKLVFASCLRKIHYVLGNTVTNRHKVNESAQKRVFFFFFFFFFCFVLFCFVFCCCFFFFLKNGQKIFGTGQNGGSIGKQQTNNFLRSVYVFLSALQFIFRRTSFNPRVRASPLSGRNDRTLLPTTNRNPNIFTVIPSLRFSLPLI